MDYHNDEKKETLDVPPLCSSICSLICACLICCLLVWVALGSGAAGFVVSKQMGNVLGDYG